MTMETDSEVRVSGLTAGQEAIRDIARENNALLEPELPEERAQKFRFPGFHRMRLDWYGDDAITMRRVQYQVGKIIDDTFHDLLAIRYELYELVRTPETENGNPKRDHFGLVIWKQTSIGNYEEDWSKLTHIQRERFLFQITTRMFEWEEKMDQLWAQAMFAKTQWEEAFSTGWEECETGKRTEGDRTAAGRLRSQDERYFAIYVTYLSRRSESLVRGMERLAQRIKDVHTA